jgi:hypothetical protein
MNDKINKKAKHDQRNARRRKRRLEKHGGIHWIDPEQANNTIRGEQALWRAVILQMLEDATNNSKKPQDKFDRDQARNWLEGKSRDFAMVCDLAGLDVLYVRGQVKKALLNQHLWKKSDPKRSRTHPENTVSTPNKKSIDEAGNNQADILSFPAIFKKSA